MHHGHDSTACNCDPTSSPRTVQHRIILLALARTELAPDPIEIHHSTLRGCADACRNPCPGHGVGLATCTKAGGLEKTCSCSFLYLCLWWEAGRCLQLCFCPELAPDQTLKQTGNCLPASKFEPKHTDCCVAEQTLK
eukprot:scaffold35290_cov23-Tisochrysis_lutea.AAC.2